MLFCQFSSAIAVLLALVFVGISSVMAIIYIVQGKAETPRMVPHMDKKTTFFDLFTAVPVIVTAFTFHFNGKNQNKIKKTLQNLVSLHV